MASLLNALMTAPIDFASAPVQIPSNVMLPETACFDLVAPEIPKVVMRPGVEQSIFHPHGGKKEFDVILGGSETPDYPLRTKINRVVRANAGRRGWKVLDLTANGVKLE